MDQEQLLLSMLDAGLSHCTLVIETNSTLLLSLFVAGLVGSATHCIGMCAPFVLSQVTARLEQVGLSDMSEFKRLSGAALIPYHLGRMTTYVVLGLGASLLAKGAIAVSGLKELSAVLLFIAALFFLGYGLKRLGISLPKLPMIGKDSSSEGGFSQALSKILKPCFARPTGWRGYVLGIGLGFLPCGLLYGALAAAGASGELVTAAFAMAAFTIGTIPALVAIALAGHMAGQKWRSVILDLAPILLIINAGVLGYLAYTLL